MKRPFFPTLWIYDLSLEAVQEKILVDQAGEARALIENEGKLFVVGVNSQNKSTLWICDLEGNLIQSVLLDQAEGEDRTSATAIIKAKQKIYITGEAQDGKGSSIPTLWILDKDGALLSTKPLSTNQDEKAGPIVCISNKLYILGSVNSTKFIADFTSYIWVTDFEGNLIRSAQFDDVNQSRTGSLLRRGNQLLVLGGKGDNQESEKPTIWVLDVDLNVVSTTSFDSTSFRLTAGTFIGSYLYTVGFSLNSQEEKYQNLFWKVLPNGAVGLTSMFGQGLPVDIIPSSTFEDSLLRANQLFSPIRPLHGVN